MISLVLAATISFSGLTPAVGDSVAPDGKHYMAPATWDSCRVIALIIPTGQFFRHWSDTLYCARGERFSRTDPAPILDNHLVITNTERLRRWHLGPPEWIKQPLSKSVIARPVP